ncbi:hypothetical protein FRC04_002827 [Tulasnella sp. 424]|nr:hypothetical protein FRC04_002827 [Tulasnella sp. 424]
MALTTVASLPRCTPKSESPDVSHSAALLESLGDLQNWNGNYEQGAIYLERALELHQSTESAERIASVHYKQAAQLYHRCEFEKSLRLSLSALDEFRELHDEVGVANASFWLSSALLKQGKEEEAAMSLNESLTIFQKQKDQVGTIRCLERMAEIHSGNGRYEDAVVVVREAIRVASSCGDLLGEANGLVILGRTEFAQRDLDKAVVTLAAAADIARRIGWNPGLITALSQLGDIEMERDAYAVAEGYYRESFGVARRCSVHVDLAGVLARLAACLRKQGRWEEMTNALEEACYAYHRVLSPVVVNAAGAASNLGGWQERSDETEKFVMGDEAATTCKRNPGILKDLSECLYQKAVILVELEQRDEAALHFEASLVLDREIRTQQESSRSQRELVYMPMTSMTWERPWWMDIECVGSTPVPQNSFTLCDVRSFIRRVPQLATPQLKLRVRP